MLVARRPGEEEAERDRLAAETLAAAADQPLATSAIVSESADSDREAGNGRQLLTDRETRGLFPAGIRDRLLSPVRAANVTPPLSL